MCRRFDPAPAQWLLSLEIQRFATKLVFSFLVAEIAKAHTCALLDVSLTWGVCFGLPLTYQKDYAEKIRKCSAETPQTPK